MCQKRGSSEVTAVAIKRARKAMAMRATAHEPRSPPMLDKFVPDLLVLLMQFCDGKSALRLARTSKMLLNLYSFNVHRLRSFTHISHLTINFGGLAKEPTGAESSHSAFDFEDAIVKPRDFTDGQIRFRNQNATGDARISVTFTYDLILQRSDRKSFNIGPDILVWKHEGEKGLRWTKWKCQVDADSKQPISNLFAFLAEKRVAFRQVAFDGHVTMNVFEAVLAHWLPTIEGIFANEPVERERRVQNNCLATHLLCTAKALRSFETCMSLSSQFFTLSQVQNLQSLHLYCKPSPGQLMKLLASELTVYGPALNDVAAVIEEWQTGERKLKLWKLYYPLTPQDDIWTQLFGLPFLEKSHTLKNFLGQYLQVTVRNVRESTVLQLST